MPRRPPNRDLRTREHLTEAEVERLMKATKDNRYGHRDATMILVAYRHGLRVSELVDLRWEQVDFRTTSLHVRRVKRGSPSTHPIVGDELRALRRLKREQQVAFRVHIGAWHAIHQFRICPHARTRRKGGQAAIQATPAYAETCLRFRSGEQRA
jgi:integrase